MNQPESGFLGVPIETDLTRLEADVAILGVPFGWPYPRPGATALLHHGPDRRPPTGSLPARFRDHWDFDLDGPMRLPHMVDAGDASDLLAGIGPRLVGAVFTEYVPALEINDISALVLARLANRVMGGVAMHRISDG